MSQVIRITSELYKRLEHHATGFDTPSNVIERILNFYEGGDQTDLATLNATSSIEEVEPADKLDIIYHPANENIFKKDLLFKKRAYIKLYYTNGQTEVKEWNASRFTEHSSVDSNLRSGYLRGWKRRGIHKAELSVNKNDLT